MMAMATVTLDATGTGTVGQHSVVDQPGLLGGRNPLTEELHGSGNSNGISPSATGSSRRNRDLTVEGSKGESISRAAPKHSFPHSISHTTRIPSRSQRAARRISQDPDSYDIPNDYVNLDELAGLSPEQNPDEADLYLRKSHEQERSQEQGYQRTEEVRRKASRENPEEGSKREQGGAPKVSKLATQLYVISYLILFSFLGTLARLGLQAITFYPGAPVSFSALWANFGGSIVMGFLSEDRMLFRDEWGTPPYHRQIQKAKRQKQNKEIESGSDGIVDLGADKKAHAATKKTIPLYVGLATGFCGCFTSFSSFIRDIFLALSNELPTTLNHSEDYGPVSAAPESTVDRNGGYSFMALLAVIITTIALCVSGLHFGAHLAIATERFMPSLPFKLWRKLLDPLAVFLAWGCWLGAILLAIFPPDRHSAPPEIWRSRAVFAIVFAPLGCLARFYASLYLNSKIASFPLGTFAVNIFGTVILGMSYDLQHVPLGGVVGCQVLEGIQDGFCGCLTTVSTWVSELSSLRRKHAYIYGATSVVIALCFLIVIMGSMQWTSGFSEIQCAK